MKYLFVFSILWGFWSSQTYGYIDPTKSLSQFGNARWDLKDGLHSNWVSDICQKSEDPSLWLGTPTGLVRFNGVSFEVFDVKTSPLLEGGVWALETDGNDRLWIGTRTHGIVYYEDGQFYQLENSDADSFPEVRILKVCSDNRLWVGTPVGLFFYKDNQLTTFGNSSLDTAFITSVFEDDDGDVWVGTQDDGLYQLSGNNSTDLKHYDQFSTIYCIQSDLAGDLWVGTKEGLHRVGQSGYNHTLNTENGLPSNSVRTLQLNSSGCLIIGTEKGMIRYYEDTIITNSDSSPFQNDFITCFFEDAEGSLWIGTKYNGLGQLWRSKFTVYSVEEGLQHPVVNVIYEDQDKRVWIGTNGGLNELVDGKLLPRFSDILGNSRIRDLFQDSNDNLWVCTYSGLYKIGESSVVHYGDEQGLTSNLVRQVLEDRDGRIWVGTRSGLVCFDGDNVKIWEAPELKNDLILHIFEDRKKKLWIATDGAGIARLDGESFTWYGTDEGLSNGVVFKITEDRKGLLWLSTANGISVFDGKEFQHLGLVDGLPSETIFQIIEDSYGSLWFTAHEGIFKVRKADLIQYLSARRKSFDVTRYGPLDGLRTYQMTGVGESCMMSDGRICFATADGASFLDLAKLNINSLNPEIYFEKIEVNGDVQFLNGHSEKEMTFGPGVKTLSIDFTSNSLIGASNILFSSRLIGFDDQFQESHDREVSFTNLSPGDYQFEVRARNSDGIWGHHVGSVKFSVKPFFHQTLLFYGLIISLSMLVGYALYSVRIYQLRKQSRDLENIVASRTEEITQQKEIIETKVLENEKTLRTLQSTNQELKKLNEEKSYFLGIAAHDMKNPLGNILFLSNELIAQCKNQADEEGPGFASMIHQSSQELLELVDTLVHSISLESGKISLEKESENISVIANSVVSMNQKYADAKQTRLITDFPEFIPGYIDSLRLRTAMDNYVSNAIKYTPENGDIEVRLRDFYEDEKRFCEFCVIDSGPGLIDKDFARAFERFAKLSARPTGKESSSGLGLSIVKQVIELHGGSVSVKNNEGRGACFSFIIPLV